MPLSKWRRVHRSLAVDLGRCAVAALVPFLTLFLGEDEGNWSEIVAGASYYLVSFLTPLAALILQKLLWGAFVLKDQPATSPATNDLPKPSKAVPRKRKRGTRGKNRRRRRRPPKHIEV